MRDKCFFTFDDFLLLIRQDHHPINPKSSIDLQLNYQSSPMFNFHNMKTISPNISGRRRAISGRHVSFAHGSTSGNASDVPLPPPKKNQTDPGALDKMPDFSCFSWKQSHMAALVCSEAAPISPRTVPQQRLLSAGVSNNEPTQQSQADSYAGLKQ